MLVLGLTGGVGMGKSTCAQLLAQRGLPIIDTDDLAREVVEPGQPALEQIRNLFGSEVFTSDGRLRRDELARRVFSDNAARKQLEAILHPRIAERWRAQVQTWRREGRAMAVVVIPLLFETGAEAELDFVVCVACSLETQNQRLAARGWSAEQIAQRIAAQWSPAQKMLKADFVIWSEGALALHAAQLDRILGSAKSRFPR